MGRKITADELRAMRLDPARLQRHGIVMGAPADTCPLRVRACCGDPPVCSLDGAICTDPTACEKRPH